MSKHWVRLDFGFDLSSEQSANRLRFALQWWCILGILLSGLYHRLGSYPLVQDGAIAFMLLTGALLALNFAYARWRQ